jgi:chromate transport protein ChrA
MKQELVTEGKWVSTQRFNKVYAVYQILPGPEATELACYFGYLVKGRLGAIVGGMGFLLPGVLLMLLWSYLYVKFGVESRAVQRSFRAVQNCVAALIFRGTYKLADGAMKAPGTTTFSWHRGFLFLFCFLTSAIKLNFFISLGVAGIMNSLFEHPTLPQWREYIAYFIAACTIGFYILYCQYEGVPSGSLMGGSGGFSQGGNPTSNGSLFVLGLIAGLVTFGGAYTTLPFIYSSAVTSGGWLTSGQFLDALAITNMMPTPLVSFVTMVGYIGNGIEGSLLMTLGIFLPAISFTVIGHRFFEKVVDNKLVEPFLEGVSSAVIGLLLLTAFQFVKGVISDGVDAVVFFLSFCAVFHFTDRYTQPITIVVAAIAGQVLY